MNRYLLLNLWIDQISKSKRQAERSVPVASQLPLQTASANAERTAFAENPGRMNVQTISPDGSPATAGSLR